MNMHYSPTLSMTMTQLQLRTAISHQHKQFILEEQLANHGLLLASN